ncbi:MAG: hypothetical protein HKN10_06175 [Myxococcales bacterium]|nr:hypothetical protein [Myxococcales bacterium]
MALFISKALVCPRRITCVGCRDDSPVLAAIQAQRYGPPRLGGFHSRAALSSVKKSR